MIAGKKRSKICRRIVEMPGSGLINLSAAVFKYFVSVAFLFFQFHIDMIQCAAWTSKQMAVISFFFAEPSNFQPILQLNII